MTDNQLDALYKQHIPNSHMDALRAVYEAGVAQGAVVTFTQDAQDSMQAGIDAADVLAKANAEAGGVLDQAREVAGAIVDAAHNEAVQIVAGASEEAARIVEAASVKVNTPEPGPVSGEQTTTTDTATTPAPGTSA